MYRAKAIRDVLPLYASGVDCAMDFLMKDMGMFYLRPCLLQVTKQILAINCLERPFLTSNMLFCW